MAHPYATQAKASGKEKLRALGGKTPHNQSDGDRRMSGMKNGESLKAMSYPLKDHGQGSGEGRLDQAKARK